MKLYSHKEGKEQTRTKKDNKRKRERKRKMETMKEHV